MAQREIGEVSMKCPSHTEIFSKRRKICSICAESLSVKLLNLQQMASSQEPMDETLKVKKSSMSTLSHASNQVDNVVDNRFNPVRYNVIAVA